MFRNKCKRVSQQTCRAAAGESISNHLLKRRNIVLDQTKLKFYRFLSAILLVVMLSMSSVMYVSAHGGDITLIHACVNNRTGMPRIVSATATCDATKEVALDWGIQGP